jgi:hypothetical protein
MLCRPYFDSLAKIVLVTLASAFLSIQPSMARSFLGNIGHEVGSCLSGGCDVVWEVNKRIDGGINSKMEAATEPVKQAAKEILTELFQKNLDPLVERLNVISEERLRQIDAIIENALGAVTILGNSITDDVKNKIIDASAAQIQAVSKAILGDYQCAVTYTKENIQALIDENLKFITSLNYFWRDSCQNGMDPGNYWTVYTALKCAYEKKIASAQTVADLQNQFYAALEVSSKARCVLLNGNNKEVVEDDERRLLLRVKLWGLALQ